MACDFPNRGSETDLEVGMHGFEPLQVQEISVLKNPIEDFFHKPGVLPRELGRGEEESFGIDDERNGSTRRGAGHSDGDPLIPKK